MENYKEKYEEALERAKGIYNKTIVPTPTVKGTCEYIFPELEESEDERIRKEIMDFIDTKTIDSDERRNRWFSYLEKYKPISLTSLEGAKVKTSLMQYISEINQDVVHLHPGIETCNEWLAWLEKQGEQKPEIKYIYPKFRVGDVIEPAKPNGHYTPVRVKYIGEGNYSCESDDRKSFLSFPICDENEYVLTKQKPAWNEEDETGLGEAMWAIEQAKTIAKDENDMGNLWYAEKWLKSLKDRYTWKPSESDILLLERIANGKSNPQDFQASLGSLIGQLKKLREK